VPRRGRRWACFKKVIPFPSLEVKLSALITALIDTYNHERYIEQAIVSVLEQGLSAEELEIVVVDDGSTDGTAGVVEKFAPRVKLVRKKNGGQASAFNAGYRESHGEIVALLDGDDWWAKGKLETVLKALEENPEVAAVSHGYFEFHEETRESEVRQPAERMMVNISTPEGVGTGLQAWQFLLMGALTVRRRVLDWIMPLPEEMTFMADSPIQVAAMVMRTLVLREPLFYYRHHGENLWAVSEQDKARMRRRFEMQRLVYGQLWRMLLERRVPQECVSTLLLPLEEYLFGLDAPSRARFFWFLMRQNYWYSARQTWRFTALNYVTPFAALIFGYEKHESMYEWRGRATEDMKRWYRRIFSANASV
jgi:glycosyltransferase involved in cell wall biosynthesis